MTNQRPKEHEYASHVSYSRALEDYCDALEGQQAQPEHDVDYWIKPLYTSPPQRQPLTDDEIVEALMPVEIAGAGYYIRIARAIEAAHGIGENT